MITTCSFPLGSDYEITNTSHDMKCVLLTTRGERLEGASEFFRLGFELEIYPTTMNESLLNDTRVDEFIPYIRRHPSSTERPHVRSLRASFVRLLEDPRYSGDDMVVFGESDAFPTISAERLEAAVRRELKDYPETDVLRLFHQALQNPAGSPRENEKLLFKSFHPGKTDANNPSVWGTHALVIPCSARAKVAHVFRTYRLPVDIALEAAASNGELRIRTAQNNLFYQHLRTEPGRDKKIAVCMSSYKRLCDLQRQLWCMMDQSYSNLHVFAALKGMTEGTYRRIIEPLFRHFVEEGRLTMRLFPNKNQVSNFVDTIRDLDVSDFDLFAKIDDDDIYGREYLSHINDFHRFLPDDFSSYYCGMGYYLNKRCGIDIANDGWYGNFGPTMVCGRSAMQKMMACEREPERIRHLSPRAGHSGYGYSEDALLHILMQETGGINREPYVRHCGEDLHLVIQCGNTSVMRGGLVEGSFMGRNWIVSHNRYNEEDFLEFRHPSWKDSGRIVGMRCRRLDNGDEATVLSQTDDSVVLKWDRWGTERFNKCEDGVYELDPQADVNGNMPSGKRTVAILFFAAKRHHDLWMEFYKRCSRYFLSGHDKHYFVFTDTDTCKVIDDVTFVPADSHTWPIERLRRFKTFLTIENVLKSYDYVYFFNRNLLPMATIGEEIVPAHQHALTVVCHPTFQRQPRKNYPYEKRSHSEAFIPLSKGKVYVTGDFYGGTSSAFLQMCQELNGSIIRDLENGVAAVAYDESHLNRYITGNHSHILPAEYLCQTLVSASKA